MIPGPDALPLAHHMQIISAFALFGLIWTVQLVVYPAFRHVAPDVFPTAHRSHTRRISWIVIPLLLGELWASVIWLRHFDALAVHQRAALACTALAWLSTFLIQVPLHHRLSQGHDSATLHRLILTNWIRTAAWTGKAVLLTGSLGG